MAGALMPAMGLVALVPENGSLIGFFPDDAFYYLQPASRMVAQGQLTFDGTNVMTGFHPLHMLVSVMLVAAVGKAYALAALLLWTAFCLGAGLTVMAHLFRLGTREASWAALATLPPFSLYLFTNAGMESSTLILASALMMRGSLIAAESHAWTWRHTVSLGAVTGVWVLARLDMVIPLMVIGPALLLTRAPREWPRALAGCAVGALLVVGPYLLWMLWTQGHVVPVSAVAKYGRERWTLAQVLLTLTGNRVEGWLLLGLAPAVAVASLVWPGRQQFGMTRAWALAVLMYTAFVLLAAHEPFRWYLNLGLFVAAALLMARLPSLDLPALRPAVVVVVVLINGAMLWSWQQVDTTSTGLHRAALRLNAQLAPGTPLATHDSGVLGFFYHGPVHNLDGLANSLSNWQRYFAKGRELEYLEATHVPYVLLRDELRSVRRFAPLIAPGAVMTIDAGRFGMLRLYRR